MIKKWYIITFIVLFTILGVVKLDTVDLPNQEIVLQFNDAEVTTEDAKNTIARVKEQLLSIGVSNIQVKALKKGSLKISYYSDAETSVIKETLSKDFNLAIAFSSENRKSETPKLPSDKNNLGFNLNVYEIQNSSDANWDFNGTIVLDFKSKNDQIFNSNTFPSLVYLNLREDSKVKVAYAVHKKITIAIDNASKSIPEVRAGPNC
jgi:hypothetical protein